MSRTFSGLLISCIIASQFQLGTLYALDQQELIDKKTQSIELLDIVGEKMQEVVDTLDSTLDDDTSLQLDKKGEEIQEYLEDAQQEILEETSSRDISEKLEEVQKVVILKVVSGITQYEDIEDTISPDVADTKQEKEEALEVIQESLEDEQGAYSLILKTKLSEKKFRKILSTLEKNITIGFLYKVGKQKYFEVSFGKDSLFSQEMLGDIENNILPESFIGIEVVQPEVFLIQTQKTKEQKAVEKLAKQQANLLKGEDLTQTWGIEKYAVFPHLLETKKASKKIKLGVVDTGIDYNHPDLKDRVLVKQGRDFVNKDRDAMDDQGHGTHVAGVIAASVNASGIVGINPHTKLVPLKICSETGFCPTYAVIKALNYASKKDIDILNMSLGGRGTPDNHPICDAISDYTSKGGIVVAASGNANIDASEFVPGGCRDAITVGAYDRNNNKAGFSNYGSKVDVLAPGTDIYSTKLRGGYHKLSGTSMATPHIAGLVSLMQSYDSNLIPQSAREKIKRYQTPSVILASYSDDFADIELAVESEEEVAFEETQEIIPEPIVLPESSGDDISVLNPEIVFIPEDSTQAALSASGSSIALNPQLLELSIGERPEGVEINSSSEKIDISQRLIDQEIPEFYQLPEIIVFDQESYDAQDNSGVEISSLGEDAQEIEVSVETNQDILDGNEQFVGGGIVPENENLVDIPEDAIEIQQVVEDLVTIPGVEQLPDNPSKIIGLPELENTVQINSIDEEFQPIEIQSYDDLFPAEQEEDKGNDSIEINSLETFTGSTIEQKVLGDVFQIDDEDIIIPQNKNNYIPSEQEEDAWFAAIDNLVEVGTGVLDDQIDQSDPQDQGVNIAADVSLTLFVGQKIEIDKQRSFNQRLSYWGHTIVELSENRGVVSLKGLSPGVVYVYLRDSRGRSLGTITVTVELPITKKTIALGSVFKTVCDSRGRMSQSVTDTNILLGSKVGDCLQVEGRKNGTTRVQTKYKGYIKDTFEITVIAPTKRTINKNQSLNINLGDAANYTYSVPDSDVVSTNLSGNTLEVTGLYGGETSIEIKSGSEIVQIIELTVLPPIENREIKIGETLSYQIGALTTGGVTRAGIIDMHRVSGSRVDMYALRIGSTDITLYDNGKLSKILRLTVIDNPEKRIKLYKGQLIKFTHGNYRNSANSRASNILQVIDSGNSNYDYFAAKNAGNVEVDISRYQSRDRVGLYRIINEPFPVETRTLLDGETILFSSDNHSVTTSDSDIVYFANNKIYSKNLGTATITVSQSGYTVKKMTITVVPPAVPVQDISLRQYLPGDRIFEAHFAGADKYSYVMDNPSDLDINATSSDIRIRGKKAGNFEVALYYKDTYVTTIRVHVESYTREQSYSIDLYDRDRNGGRGFQYVLSNAYDYTYSVSTPGIIAITGGSQDLFFSPLQEGSTQIYIKKDGYHLYTVNFTVSVPQAAADIIPKILKTCETQQDGTCNVYVGEDFGLKYTYSNPGIIKVNTTPDFRDGIIVTGQEVGTTSLYIYKGDQHHYTLDVVVSEKEKPVERFLYCTIEQGGACQVYFEDAIEYNYIATQRGIFDADLTQNTIEITGKAVGESKLYIYHTKTIVNSSGVPETTNTYFYTIYVDVETPADPLSADVSDIALSLGQRYDLKMTSGNGEYTMSLANPEMMSHKLLGDIFSMKALKEGSTSMSITDSTNRTITMNVTITSELELDDRTLTIELGESGYLRLIKGSERYGVEKSNSNVEVYRTNDETFEVKALKLGTTAIKITDEFNNGTTANITVIAPGGSGTEDTTIPKIRYIRDWLSGSNRNGGNHWVEIEAIDSNGNNLAGGKLIQSDYEGYAPRPLSRITDGNTTSGAYASGGSGLKYVQVDLGGIRDIEKIRVLHYYYDGYTESKSGRIYNKTKTEVSQDGKIWYTIFDSDISGTYIEPQDGSGKTHQIPKDLFGEHDTSIIPGNLVKNGNFNGKGEKRNGGFAWLGGQENGWRTYNKNQAKAGIKDGRLYLENPGEASYVEVRNTSGGYYGITHDSIKIKPNTLYRVEYDYETHYISGTHKYGFKLALLASDTSGVKADLFETIPYVNTSQGVTHVKHEFKTPANAQYLNISPVIYGHWGDKNLNMKAWVDNLSLVEVSEKKPTQVQGGIRYIRDWTNKANNSSSNVWTEIQAIERTTGINRAKGIIPTTDITSPTGSLSRLTDGSITTGWTGKSGGNKLSYMQLDLGATYDIEEIKVWHYQDGRIFSDTKTEVSADGVNWTTLFDSAVDGTYAEPRDGSGRSYELKTSVGEVNAQDQFFQSIGDIFEEYNLNSGVQINSEQTDLGKKQAIQDGTFIPEFVNHVDGVLENIYTKISIETLQNRVSILKQLNDRLESRDSQTPEGKALVNYIIYSFQEKMEYYEAQLYKTEIDNPFEKKYAAQLKVYSSQIHANIILGLTTQGYTLEFIEQNHGGLYSKKGLDFLLLKGIISNSDHQKYIIYTPSVESIIDVLDEEGSIHALLKIYYPESIGASDGMKKALADYLQENIDLIDPRELPGLLFGIYQTIGKLVTGDIDRDKITEGFTELYDIFKEREEIFAGLDPYKRAYYEGYLGTTISLAFIPVKYGKAGKYVKGKGDTKDIGEVKKYRRLKSVTLSQKAQKRMDETGRFIPIQTQKGVIVDGIKRSDPQGSSANMFYHKITKNGKAYNVEVLYDEDTNQIWHFLYTDADLGPLKSTK